MKHIKQYKLFEQNAPVLNAESFGNQNNKFYHQINIQELLQEYIDEYDMYPFTDGDDEVNGIFYYFVMSGIGNSVPDDMTKLVILMTGIATEKYVDIFFDMRKFCQRLKSAGYSNELVEWKFNAEKTKIIDIYINI